MTRPQPPRTTDVLLQDHQNRIRVLESIPPGGSIGWESVGTCSGGGVAGSELPFAYIRWEGTQAIANNTPTSSYDIPPTASYTTDTTILNPNATYDGEIAVYGTGVYMLQSDFRWASDLDPWEGGVTFTRYTTALIPVCADDGAVVYWTKSPSAETRLAQNAEMWVLNETPAPEEAWAVGVTQGTGSDQDLVAYSFLVVRMATL